MRRDADGAGDGDLSEWMFIGPFTVENESTEHHDPKRNALRSRRRLLR